MILDELEYLINRLVKIPLKKAVSVDFNRDNKTFRLTSVVYEAPTKLPTSLESYIKKLEGRTFQPHKTSYVVENTKIHLVQELPFEWGFQPGFRNHTIEFWRLSKHCHAMLSEIATEPS